MIILRNKYFSSKKAQLLYKLKKTADQIGTSFNNAGLKTGDTINRIITGKNPRPNFKFTPKTDVQLKREALTTNKQLDRAKNSVILDPGGTTGKLINDVVVEPAKHAPLGTVATKVIPVPGLSAIHAKTTAPLETRMWDKTGIGKVFKPVRRRVDKVINSETMTGAGRGVYNGLKLAIV